MESSRIAFPVELHRDAKDVRVVSIGMPNRHIRTPFVEDAIGKECGELAAHSASDDRLVRPLLRPDAADAVHEPIHEFVARHGSNFVGATIIPIFHMSRCGSTLASRMLAECDRMFVLSEPPIVNSILDPAMPLSSELRVALLRASINAMVRSAPPKCDTVVIKFRSWNILFHELIMMALGDLPWVFIHRYGIEVLASVLGKPPGWQRSRRSYSWFFGPVLGLSAHEVDVLSAEEFACRLLGTFCRKAVAAHRGRCLAINYTDIVTHLHDRLDRHYQVRFTDSDRQLAARLSEVHSKDVAGLIPWRSDTEKKRAVASESQCRLAEIFIEAPRAQLLEG